MIVVQVYVTLGARDVLSNRGMAGYEKVLVLKVSPAFDIRRSLVPVWLLGIRNHRADLEESRGLVGPGAFAEHLLLLRLGVVDGNICTVFLLWVFEDVPRVFFT